MQVPCKKQAASCCSHDSMLLKAVVVIWKVLLKLIERLDVLAIHHAEVKQLYSLNFSTFATA